MRATGSLLCTANRTLAGHRAERPVAFLLSQCYRRPRPVHRGRLRRRARVGAGCGVLRAWLVTTLPGGSGNRPPPLRADASELADGEACLLHPAPDRSQQTPRWSAERRASRVMGRKAPACACGPTSLARRRVPLHPSACRRSAPLAFVRGNSKPRRSDASRER